MYNPNAFSRLLGLVQIFIEFYLSTLPIIYDDIVNDESVVSESLVFFGIGWKFVLYLKYAKSGICCDDFLPQISKISI